MIKSYKELNTIWKRRISGSINYAITNSWPRLPKPKEDLWNQWISHRIQQEDDSIFYVHSEPITKETLEVSCELLKELETIFDERHKKHLTKMKKD